MATKKKTAKKKAGKKKAGKASSVTATPSIVLKFDPRRFTDPGPDAFKNISAAAVRQLESARNLFVKQVNTILKGR
jgi:hypothetical protein